MTTDTEGRPLMMIRELKKHFPARLPEWWNAWTMLAWGAYVLMHPGIFDDAIYTGLVAVAESWSITDVNAERQWGMITMLVAGVRLAALFVNGSYSRTPLIRLVCSLASAFVWSQVVIGLFQLEQGSTGLVMYTAVLLLDLASAYRAGVDTGIAEATRRAQRNGGARVNNSGSSSGLVGNR